VDVLFAVLPFADPRRATLGVALLQAALDARAFSTLTRHFNLDFAEAIGLESYAAIANVAPPDALLGEWVFADMLFGSDIPDGDEYLAKVVVALTKNRELAHMAAAARRHCHRFVREAAAEVAALAPGMVGFTTTFHQTCACVALARELKKLRDPPIVVFGGANCEGVMGLELLRQFECIDFVCTQEGDAVFPAFVEHVLRDAPGSLPHGMVGRARFELPERPLLVSNLDSLPVPLYRDYFEQLSASPLRDEIEPALQIETSRGCWWGAKHHCTFCGLNGATMAYRRKSPDRVFDEITGLVKRWGIGKIEAVDNILDPQLIDTLFPRLAKADLDLELFYEVKSNLHYSQLVALRAGGLRAIQPGIESFSDQALQLMDKGITGLRNIQLLRWCRELGISVSWNILVGFPGEDLAEIDWMTRLLAKLTHLDRPSACSKIRLDRFSPLFVQAEERGLRRVRPNHAYYYIFPFEKKSLAQLAYFFEYDYEDGRKPDEYTLELGAAVQRWWAEQARDEPAVLDAWVRGDHVDVADSRAAAVQTRHRLEGLDAAVLMVCDSVQSFVSIRRDLREAHPDAIAESLRRLLELRLLEESRGHYVSLPVFRERAHSIAQSLPAPHEAASTAALHVSH
jgi:ribosomal peptide maturation radical SAM protein 1